MLVSSALVLVATGVALRDDPEGLPADRGPRADLRLHRGRAGHRRSRRWSSTSRQVAAIVAQDPGRRRASLSSVGAGRRRARRQPGASFVAAEAARASAAVGRRDHPRAAAASSRRSRASACSCRTRRRSASAASSRKSQYQYTLQDPTRRALRVRADARGRRCGRCRASRTSRATCRSRNPQLNVDDRPRPRRRARRHGAADRERALHAYGRARSRRSTRRTNQYQVILELAAASSSATRRHLRRSTCARQPGTLVPLVVGRDDHARASGPLDREPPGQLPAVTISFNLAAGRLARRRGRGDRAGGATTLPATITTSFQGTAQAFQASLQGLGLLLVVAILVDLHRARHPVRELHPPAHDPVGPAVRAASARSLTLMLFGIDADASTPSSASSCWSAS